MRGATPAPRSADRHHQGEDHQGAAEIHRGKGGRNRGEHHEGPQGGHHREQHDRDQRRDTQQGRAAQLPKADDGHAHDEQRGEDREDPVQVLDEGAGLPWGGDAAEGSRPVGDGLGGFHERDGSAEGDEHSGGGRRRHGKQEEGPGG
jgi:hypothetical protein